jgi:PAS domain S-box-containing protein
MTNSEERAMTALTRRPPAPDFRKLFESAPGLYLVLTPELTIVAVSDAYLRATMTKREEILGQGLFEVFPDNPADTGATGVRNLRASLERVLRERAPDAMAVQKYDIQRPESEGGGFEERFWSPVNSAVLGEDGQVAYIIHRVEDVTEFVRLKQKGGEQSRANQELLQRAEQMEAEVLRRSAAIQELNRELDAANVRWELAGAANDDGVWDWRPGADEIYWSARIFEMLGYAPDEIKLTVSVFRSMIHPDDLCKVDEALNAHLSGRSPVYEVEYRVKNKDGNYRWIRSRGKAAKGPGGPNTRMVGLHTDIDQRRRGTDALRESETMFRGLLESAPDAIVIVNEKGLIELVNTQAERLFGYSADELRGQPVEMLIPQRYRTGHEKVRSAYLAAPMVREMGAGQDLFGIRKDGTEVPVEISLSPMRTPKGLFVTSAIRDITERKQAEKELIRAKAAAEEANRAKSSFLAKMSHEIRTPMTAILGYADMLLDPAQSASDRLDRVQTIRRNAEQLLTILNDILDISKIEADKLDVEIIETDACEVLNDVISLMRVRALEKGITLDVAYAGQIPRKIETDPTRLRQILINLVGNAIKFTESGGVNVVATFVKSPGRAGQLRFTVTDTGIGMTVDQLQGLFRPFEQADNSTTRRFGGSGLGLSICKRLAQMLGGDIVAQSNPGVGSSFIATVSTGDLTGVPMVEDQCEIARPRAARAAKAKTIHLSGRILLAEDGVHNQRVVAFYLEKAGAAVAIAENGMIACEMAAESLRAGKPFDLILMDMQMPVMDGYTASATLRSRGWRGPIIALTAHAMSHDRAKCIQAGCTDYLSKPIDRDTLLAMVARHFGRSTEAAMGNPQAEAKPAAAKPIHSTQAHDPAVARYLPQFVADLPQIVSGLAAQLDQRALDGLREAIHKIKGAGGVYGFMKLTNAARRAEELLLDAKPFEDVAREVNALMDLIRRVEGYDASKESKPSRIQ